MYSFYDRASFLHHNSRERKDSSATTSSSHSHNRVHALKGQMRERKDSNESVSTLHLTRGDTFSSTMSSGASHYPTTTPNTTLQDMSIDVRPSTDSERDKEEVLSFPLPPSSTPTTSPPSGVTSFAIGYTEPLQINKLKKSRSPPLLPSEPPKSSGLAQRKGSIPPPLNLGTSSNMPTVEVPRRITSISTQASEVEVTGHLSVQSAGVAAQATSPLLHTTFGSPGSERSSVSGSHVRISSSSRE